MPTGTDSFNVFDATGPVSDDFLDGLVMASLLGIDSNLNSTTSAATGRANGCDTSADKSSSMRAINPQNIVHHSSSAGEGKALRSPTCCIDSPISNEDTEAFTGNEYVFGIGNPPTVSGPGAPNQESMLPLGFKLSCNAQLPEITNFSSKPRENIGTAASTAGNKHMRPSANSFSLRPAMKASEGEINMDHYLLSSAQNYNSYPHTNGKSREAIGSTSGDMSSFFPDMLGQGFIGHESASSTPNGYSSGHHKQRISSGELINLPEAPRNVFGSRVASQAGNPHGSFINGTDHMPYNGVIGTGPSSGVLGLAPSLPSGSGPAHALSFLEMFRSESSTPTQQKSQPQHQFPALVTSTGGLLNFRKKKRKADGAERSRKSQDQKWTGLPAPSRVITKGHSLVKEPGTMMSISDLAILSSPSSAGNPRLNLDVIPPRSTEHSGANSVQPSKFCHVCLRRAGRVTLLSCANALEGSCRKVVCKKCFETFSWDWEEAIQPNSRWSCTHCRQECPQRAQCHIYKRTNNRRHQALLARRQKEESEQENGFEAARQEQRHEQRHEHI